MEREVYNISYSSLMDWNKCPHFFKLRAIEGISVFDSSPDTIFGSLMHKCSAKVVVSQMSTDEAKKLFSRTWTKFSGIYGKYINKKKYDLYFMLEAGLNILSNIREAFTKNLGNYKIISDDESVEKRIKVKISEKHKQSFKGFLDLVLVHENGTVVILDLKTCSSLFWFRKKIDKFKEMQLVLYKHFYAKLFDIESSKIEAYFVPLEKNPKSREPVSFLRVTTGTKKTENDLVYLDKAATAINNGNFIKNRSSCIDDYGTCPFYKTPHCT